MYKFNSLDTDKKDTEFSEESRQNKRKSINLESIFEENKKKKRTLSVPLANHKSTKNSKQLQINALKTKLNKSLQEKKLINNSLDDSILFNIKNSDSTNCSHKNGLGLKLNNLIKKLPTTETKNCIGLVSAYSSDDEI